MSVVTLLDVKVLNNPAAFNDSYQFEITFESLENLQKDLEWKLTYVGSAQSAEHDQELDSLLVGPIPPGINKFVFEADSPQMTRIPDAEIVGVTVILLTCSYDGREFVRVGYYVNNEYADPELAENPPAKPVIEKIRRNILAEKPRVTRFAIKWDSEASAPPEFPPDQPEADALPDDEAAYGADDAEEEEEEGAAAAEGAAPVEGEDTEMGGTEEAATVEGTAKEEEDEDETGSVDLEDESSEDEDEEEGEEGEEGDEEMDGGEEAATAKANGEKGHQPTDVMVH